MRKREGVVSIELKKKEKKKKKKKNERGTGKQFANCCGGRDPP